MRIWDCPCSQLDRQHLLGEHHELHTMWSVITRKLKGYSRHPETIKWSKNLPGLRKRHDEQVGEMQKRGYNHKSPLKIGDIIKVIPVVEIAAECPNQFYVPVLRCEGGQNINSRKWFMNRVDAENFINDTVGIHHVVEANA